MNIWLSLKKHLLFLQDNLFFFSDFHSDISSAFQFLTPTFQIESSNLKVVTDKTVIDIWTIIFLIKSLFYLLIVIIFKFNYENAFRSRLNG